MFESLMEEGVPKRNSSCWKQRTVLEKCLLLVFILAAVVIISLLIAVQTARPILNKSISGDGKSEKLESNGTKVNNSDLDGKILDSNENTTNANNSDLQGKYISNVICSNNEDEVCVTPSCIKAAANVLRSIDTNVEPCDNFYRFACGKYIDNTVIPDDKTAITTFTDLTDQLQQRLRTVLAEPIREDESNPIKLVKNYYQACTNKKAIENHGLKILKDILKEAGGWPVLEGKMWNDGDFDWKELMYKFSKIGFDTTPFIELSVGTDLKNSSIRCIQLDQPEFGLSREFLVKGVDDKLVKAYFNYMVDIAVEFGCDRSTAEAELKESLEFEINMAKFSMPKEERRNITKLYNVMSINELQEKYSNVPWLEFINKLLPPEVQVGTNETLILISPKYMSSMTTLVHQTTKRVQANYAIWRAIKEQISYLTEEVQQKQLDYSHAFSGITEKQIRWKECVDEAARNLPILASALYIRKYFHEDAKKNAVEMVKYIRESFRNILNSLDWMDEVTRQSALDKAEAVVAHTGYPDELLDNRKLEEYYKTLEVDADQYLKSHLNIEIHNNIFAAKRLREPVNKTDWMDHGSVAQVNAFYHPLENSIMFPAGILQGSFFNEDRPRYMNYAAIGSVIGHELTHGFDDTGRQFDKDGNLVDWWAHKTKESFLQKAQCIIHQYGNYTVTGTKENLNGINTQGENIADNGGIKEAYLAYKTWVKNNGVEPKLPGLNYSPNQLFWISGAMNWCAHYRPEILTVLIATDSHSLNEFRVLGPFSNLEYFAEDFNCPLGSKMNPKHKCSVW